MTEAMIRRYFKLRLQTYQHEAKSNDHANHSLPYCEAKRKKGRACGPCSNIECVPDEYRQKVRRAVTSLSVPSLAMSAETHHAASFGGTGMTDAF